MNADIVILGSSFSGSLLGWILARQGLRVVLLDRDSHPRFAIGESSTPVADMLISRLAEHWDLPALAPLARYGSWRKTYPAIRCGKKRGFSYFAHDSAGNTAGRAFADSCEHVASLLVAASANDDASDTHWLRSDVDAFFFAQALSAGVDGRESCTVERLERTDRWHVGWRHDRTGATEYCESPLVVDASGSGALLARVLGLVRLDDSLATRTACIYTHVEDLGSWDTIRLAAGDVSTTTPFRSDDAAQHHLVAGGWFWMLRFDAGLASVGLVRRQTDVVHGFGGSSTGSERTWHETFARYPSLAAMLEGARRVRPLAETGRLTRLWSRASGVGWAMLPTTCGFVDPLQSTGIAHAISGVDRVARLVVAGAHDTPRWNDYGRDVVDEVCWIDSLISACYECLDDFSLFTFACHLTFIATIHHERAIASGDGVGGFLSCRNRPLRESLHAARMRLVGLARSRSASGDGARPPRTCSSREAALDDLRSLLAPWDPAGLLDPAAHNRFAHSAASKPRETHASQSCA